MERIFKFRGKDLNGSWKKGDLVTEDNEYSIRNNCISYYVQKDTISQFTGFYNKNGTEIYEGDIIIKSYPFEGFYKCVWNQKRLSFDFYNINGDNEEFLTTLDFKSDEIEVIGNIYDKPKNNIMRQIKFRAKSLLDNKWVYGDLNIRSAFAHIHTDCGERINIDTETIGMFTGLFDSKGKEIYEGDIIESNSFSHSQHYVQYLEKEAMFVAIYNAQQPLIDYCSITQSWIDKYDKQIIGNIYDSDRSI